ncbi:MAG: hypothetical protein HDR06_03495 [Lachnospiraceae bacterium]|nr:hypothetical protein [Lachnospiraceae bacterium]
MGNKIIINDNEMYQYFEDLLHTDNSLLPLEWKKATQNKVLGLTNHDVSSLLGAKTLLYEQNDAEKQLCLLENMQKFLYEYIGIGGLEELLVNNYGTIENSIFLEHDGKGNPIHTREHAKHQMKNAFLGSKLLLEFNYAEDMAKTIYRAEGITTQYLVFQAHQILDEASSVNDVLAKLRELTYKIFMVSSMLHDIGYPLEFYLRSTQTLTDYPPYLNILSPIIKTEFAEIKAYLLESQLFRQVDHEEIKRKYQNNNHGVLSAISLLMHFYHNGKIYSLSCEDRCIIEMSAIAIYRHTDRFSDGFRMVYLLDPISYMVRLCDDLQEWERFKLLISNKHNYLQCSNCGKLITERDREYSCPCGKKYTKVTQIKNRKVNYICLCDSLSLESNYISGKELTLIEFDFDYMKQIEILLDDYLAVKRTSENLLKVKELVEDQSMQPKITINFSLSNNPITLIDYMIRDSEKSFTEIEKWISKQGKKKRANLEKFYSDYMSKKKNNPFGKEIETNSLKYEKEVQEYVLKYYGEIYSLYQMLTLN